MPIDLIIAAGFQAKGPWVLYLVFMAVALTILYVYYRRKGK